MFSEEEKKAISVAKGTLIALYNKKMSELKDQALQASFFSNCIISGGCISSIMLGSKVNDIDVYCKHTKNVAGIAKYITARPDLIKSIDNTKYSDMAQPYMTTQPKMITENAITLINDVQFITFMSEEEGARKAFDFIHCAPYFDIAANKLYISEAQVQAIKNMELIPNIDIDRITARRVDKYKQRGWKIMSSIEKQIRSREVPMAPLASGAIVVDDDGEWEN